MARLPWTKFQDFYLRLGFLKVLMAILDPGRRSAANQMLSRRLQDLLFIPAPVQDELWKEVEERFPWFPKSLESRSARKPTVSEALLIIGDCPSQLHAVTEKTAYKILDWARDLQLIAAGNQISEKGLLLRSLMPAELVAKFLSGDFLSWNPFVLSNRERLFFLFHLCEVDQLIIELLDEIARPGVTDPIETAQAGEYTCRALFRVLEDSRARVAPADLPALRRARDLASVMADELEIEDLIAKRGSTPRTRLPKPAKIPSRTSKQIGGVLRTSRKTTKNTDHQTIPRFEQLVDLGFLRKPISSSEDPEEEWKARRHWRYERLQSCKIWSAERQRTLGGTGPWEWRGFSTTAVSSGVAGSKPRQKHPKADIIANFLWDAYEKIHRPVGHTPFHSIALMAMIEATLDGFVIEVRDYHDLMIAIKKRALLRDHVFFASGNEIDKMFVVLRPGFVERVREVSGELDVPAIR